MITYKVVSGLDYIRKTATVIDVNTGDKPYITRHGVPTDVEKVGQVIVECNACSAQMPQQHFGEHKNTAHGRNKKNLTSSNL